MDLLASRMEGLVSRVALLEANKVDRDEIAHLKGGTDLADLKKQLEAKITTPCCYEVTKNLMVGPVSMSINPSTCDSRAPRFPSAELPGIPSEVKGRKEFRGRRNSAA